MDQKKIGKYIAEKRKTLGLTQVQLAEKLNMSNKSVSKWERGVCLPDVSLYSTLCEVLGISLNEFLAGEDLLEKEIIPKSEENIINIATDSKRSRRRSSLLIIFLLLVVLVVSGLLINFLSNKDTFLQKHCVIPLTENSPEVQTANMLTDEDNTYFYRYSVKESYDRMQVKAYWYKDGHRIDEDCLLSYQFSGDHLGEGIVAIIDDEQQGGLEAKLSLKGNNYEYSSDGLECDEFSLPLDGDDLYAWQSKYTRQVIVPQNKIPISPNSGEAAILLMVYDDDPSLTMTDASKQNAFWPQIREYCNEVEEYDYAVFITVKTWTDGPVIKVWP